MQNSPEGDLNYSVLMEGCLPERSILFERFDPDILQKNIDILSRLHRVLLSFGNYGFLPPDLINHYARRVYILAKELSKHNPLQMMNEFITSQQIRVSKETPEIITPRDLTQGIMGDTPSPVWMIPSHETVFPIVKDVMELSNIDPRTVEILTLDRHPDLVSLGDTRPSKRKFGITKAVVNEYFLELGATVSVFGIPPQSYKLTVRPAITEQLPAYFVDRSIYDNQAVLIMQRLMQVYGERLHIQDPTEYIKRNSRVKRSNFIKAIAQRLESCESRGIKYIIGVIDLDVLNTLREQISAPEYSIFMELLTLGITHDSKLEEFIEEAETSLERYTQVGLRNKTVETLYNLINHISSHTYMSIHTMSTEEGPLFYKQIFLEPGGLSVNDCCKTLHAIREICDKSSLKFGIPGFTGGICEFEHPDYRGKTKAAMLQISESMTQTVGSTALG